MSNFFPKMLSFTRSLETTEALMYGIDADGRRHIVEVVETGQRGQSGFAKLNNEKASKAGKSNPQMVEIARLPVGCEKLMIAAAVRIMPNSKSPAATDAVEAYDTFAEFSQKFASLGGFKDLSARYIENIANGRFAWRNRTLTDDAIVRVTFLDKKVEFDTSYLEVGEILGIDAVKTALIEGTADDVDALVEHVATGLSDRPVSIHFEWVGSVLPNTEVYPSQEYKYKKEESDASRMLSWVKVWQDEGYLQQATMHAQKIGAAIRAIDDWHGDALYGAIPVNAYAGVQETGHAVRHGNKKAPSYYDLAKKPKLFLDDMENGKLNDNAHFFMASLIRGGVYGGKDN